MAARAKKSNSEAKLARLRAELIVALAGIDESLDVQRTNPATVVVVAFGDPLVDFHLSTLRVPREPRWYPFNVDSQLHWGYLRESVARLVAARREHGSPALMAAQRALDDELQAALGWARALRALGVPAGAELGVVKVDDLGLVPLPNDPTEAAKRFVEDRTRSSLDKIIGRARREIGAEVWLDRKATDVRIRIGSNELGRITRYRVQIGRDTILAGDVLAKQADWTRVRQAVRARYAAPRAATSAGARRPKVPASKPAVPAPSTVRFPPKPTIVSIPGPASGTPGARTSDLICLAFPATLPASARDSAMAASRRLRAERRLVPAITVEVGTPAGCITFEPLEEGQNPLELRFTFERAGRQLEAGLRLKRPDDPISLRLDGTADDEIVGIAWATALIVYAELTCHDPAEPATPVPVSARDRRSHATVSGPHLRTATQLGRHARTGQSEIRVATLQEAIRELHSVSGHLRRLRVGGRASDAQRRLAESVGVRLPDGFTWVRPHSRGGERRVVVAWPAGLPLWQHTARHCASDASPVRDP